MAANPELWVSPYFALFRARPPHGRPPLSVERVVLADTRVTVTAHFATVIDLGGPHDPPPASARFVDGEGSSEPGGQFSAPVILLGRPKEANRSWSWKAVLRLMPDAVTVKTWRVFRAYPPSWARV
jgi:hypothetical protein